jgi:peptidoglycan/LPS O-acetylase OafA/YrhL
MKTERKATPLRVRWYSYALAVVLGLAALFITAPSPPVDGAAVLTALTLLVACCTALGMLLGFLWPLKRWLWGLWLAAPMWIVVIMSFLFAGGSRLLLTKDLPTLAIVTVGGCGGAYLGAKARRWRTRPD